jgi:hypothetical protein
VVGDGIHVLAKAESPPGVEPHACGTQMKSFAVASWMLITSVPMNGSQFTERADPIGRQD